MYVAGVSGLLVAVEIGSRRRAGCRGRRRSGEHRGVECAVREVVLAVHGERVLGLLGVHPHRVAEGVEDRRTDERHERRVVRHGDAHGAERVRHALEDARRGVADGAVEVEEDCGERARHVRSTLVGAVGRTSARWGGGGAVVRRSSPALDRAASPRRRRARTPFVGCRSTLWGTGMVCTVHPADCTRRSRMTVALARLRRTAPEPVPARPAPPSRLSPGAARWLLRAALALRTSCSP